MKYPQWSPDPRLPGLILRSIEVDLSKIEAELAELPLRADGSGERWYFVWRHIATMHKRSQWKNMMDNLQYRVTMVEIQA